MLATSIRSMAFTLLGLLSIVPPVCADSPQVNVTNVRRVFHNGEHNAFTDLVRFRDRYYLTFRSCPDGHMVHPTSSIIVLESPDLKAWKPVYRFSVPLRDTRDPHFLIFANKLFIYTGTWFSGKTTLPREDYDLNKHLGYAVFTGNGKDWSAPTMLEGTFGHYIWRATTFDGKAYLCGRRKREFAMAPRGEGANVESAMLVSDDGLVWKTHAIFQEERGDETAFHFNDDGSILAIGRRGSDKAQVLRSAPPYTSWERRALSQYVGGPLLARWGDRLVVGGRRNTPDGQRTSMYWFTNDQLHEFARMPSGGDNSYPGFVQLSDRRATMSWYSSHETDGQDQQITAIYMADLEIQE